MLQGENKDITDVNRYEQIAKQIFYDSDLRNKYRSMLRGVMRSFGYGLKDFEVTCKNSNSSISPH
uniref:Bm13365 n=1 Tax=Brugia malayi TaxID=6279 RepID=A0A1I9G000_BRUMA|nr:Bm13365 [Brugia malayi]